MKKIAALSALVGISISTVFAGDYWAPTKNPVPDKNPPIYEDPCFAAGELNFDIISIYADPTGSELEDGVGGGIGLGYFFTENIGVQTRAYWWDANSAIHSITASAVVRAPISDTCFAPYLFGGIGGHFDSVNQVSGHAGAGVEYRLTDSVGIIADYTYTWADTTEDWHLYTLGLRFAF